MSLDGKTIVVTGGSSGLGKAMAEAFVTEGADVVCASRTEQYLKSAVEEITTHTSNGDAIAVQADVRSWDDVRSLIAKTNEHYGKIDVFVNNAGVTQEKVNTNHTRQPIQDIPIATWDTILNTNLRGVFLCTKAALPNMLSHDSGRFIHISSGYGVSGGDTRAPYVASKFGLEGFHETLADELADTALDSLTLRPPDGGVYTDSWERYERTPDSFTHTDPEVIAEAAVQLAAGAGENGGRYQATPEGDGYTEYSRSINS